MDYTPQSWVDDDGSGGVGTVFTAARMDTIEAGVQDAAEHHKTGLDSAKPVASAANTNWRYYATDTRIEYQSNGVTWVALSMAPAGPAGGDLTGTYPNPGVSKLSLTNTRFGTGGVIHSFNAAYVVLNSNWTGDTDLPLDTARPGWRIEMDGRSGFDYLKIRRAAATAGAPSWTELMAVTSAGVVSAAGNLVARSGLASVVSVGAGAGIGAGTEPGILIGSDLSLYRDSSARAKLEGTVAGDTVAMIRNKSASGFSGWQLNDQNDVGRAFMGWANSAVTANQYMRFNPGTNPLRLMYNGVTKLEINDNGLVLPAGAQVTSAQTPTSGAGLELGYTGAIAYIQGQNRNLGQSLPTAVNGLSISLQASGTERYKVDATGMSWWGAPTIARPARPTTLTEVINVLANYGLTL